jgi:hypothetical protein
LALLPRPSPRLSLASRAAAWTGSRAAWALGSTTWSTRRHSCPHWCTKICHLDLVLHPRAVAGRGGDVLHRSVHHNRPRELHRWLARTTRRGARVPSVRSCRFCTCLSFLHLSDPPNVRNPTNVYLLYAVYCRSLRAWTFCGAGVARRRLTRLPVLLHPFR